MPKVTLKHKNENFESLMRRFKRSVDRSDILKTLRKYEFYERPGDARKRALAAAVKRQERMTQEFNWIRDGIPVHLQRAMKKDSKKKRWQEEDNDTNVSGLY